MDDKSHYEINNDDYEYAALDGYMYWDKNNPNAEVHFVHQGKEAAIFHLDGEDYRRSVSHEFNAQYIKQHSVRGFNSDFATIGNEERSCRNCMSLISCRNGITCSKQETIDIKQNIQRNIIPRLWCEESEMEKVLDIVNTYLIHQASKCEHYTRATTNSIYRL